MRAKLLAILQVISTPAVAIGGSVAIAVLVAGGTWYFTQVSPAGAYTAAAEAPITQEVDVSGPVESAQETDLSFQVPGQIASIAVKVGDQVVAGQTLLTLAGGSQAAALASAEANLESAEANLALLQAGTRPEQLAIDQNAVAQDQSALRDAIQSAYVSADTAVHADVDPLFQNPRTNATFTPVVPDSALVNTINQERMTLEPVFSAWETMISSSTFTTNDPTVAGETSSQNLSLVTTFLNNVAEALAETPPSSAFTAATLASYEASVAGARTGVAASASAVTAATSALSGASGALALANAGATSQSIAQAQAQADAAQAAVDSAKVAAGETVLSAPIAGTITAQNANPGETVAPGTSLVSLQSNAAFEAKAPVSESDIAKVKLGDVVNVTFDGYGGVTFPATITEIDPAATITNGIASYTVTATFSGNDPRIEAGLTAHLAIITASVPEALVIPESAVIADASGGQFVYVKNPTGPDQKVAVTTGIESTSGTVQILSGLSAGEQVLTFGSNE